MYLLEKIQDETFLKCIKSTLHMYFYRAMTKNENICELSRHMQTHLNKNQLWTFHTSMIPNCLVINVCNFQNWFSDHN